MMKESFRYLALVFGIIFMVFAAFQYNDPDPEIWVPIYGIAAVVSFAVFKRWFNVIIIGILVVSFLAGAFYMWPGTYEGITLEMGYRPEIEEARESLGLLICGLAMGFYLIAGLGKK